MQQEYSPLIWVLSRLERKIIDKGDTMNRREFVGSSLLAASSLYLSDKKLAAREMNPKKLTAGDVHNYLRSLGADWVDSERTVDTFKAGSPDMPVKGIAVGWCYS